MGTISISDQDVGTAIASGDGTVTELALVSPGAFSPTPLALVNRRGSILFLSDSLGLVPLGDELWGNLLSDYAPPFTNGLKARSVPPGSSWRATLTP
jgi:hypothetical protein